MVLGFYDGVDGGGIADIELNYTPLTSDELLEFGNVLYEWRIDNRITLRGFTKMLGLNSGTLISAIERGGIKTEISKFNKIPYMIIGIYMYYILILDSLGKFKNRFKIKMSTELLLGILGIVGILFRLIIN